MRNAKKIVCFGGGNAVPELILSHLKKENVLLTSVTSMIDNGGSTGQLRKDFNVLPPGDIRRHILALSSSPKWKKDLWNFRFGNEEFAGGHKGHNFANVFIAGLEYNLKNYTDTLAIVHNFMDLKKHRALPATIKKTQLIAELENGDTIKGEDEIDVPKTHNPRLKITKVFLKPRAVAYGPVLSAIKNADLLVLGPGDLYSSIIPCLLPVGIKKAVQNKKKVFICPAMTKLGETNNFSVLDFTKEVEKYLGSDLDFIIYNNKAVSEKRLSKYKKKHQELLELVAVDKVLEKNKFIGRNILKEKGDIVFDSEKIIEIIMQCRQ